jgi:hypothetical protein
MIDFIKKLIIGVFLFGVLVLAGKIVFATFSLTSVTKDIFGALKETKAGVNQLTGNQKTDNGDFFGGSNSGSSNTTLKTFMKSSTGADGDVKIKSIGRGEMIHDGDVISGLIRGTWLYMGTATLRILDENGMEVGRSQIKAVTESAGTSLVPFEAVVYLNNVSTETGYISFENANTTGKNTRDLKYVLPVTFGGSGKTPTSNFNDNPFL